MRESLPISQRPVNSWTREKNANLPFHCHTSLTLLTRLFYFKDNAADLQWSREESIGSSGEQHHRITGRKDTHFKFTGGCAICLVHPQQKKEKLPLSAPDQNSECGQVSWTSFKLLAIGPGEPKSLHFWVSGFDSRGRAGVYGKELPN